MVLLGLVLIELGFLFLPGRLIYLGQIVWVG
nr:MAG TPA: hypothetical protein [Caudoviricetes sp.]